MEELMLVSLTVDPRRTGQLTRALHRQAMGNQWLPMHREQMTGVEVGFELEYGPPSMPADAPWESETNFLHENRTWDGNGIWSGPINPQDLTLTEPVAFETGGYGYVPSNAGVASAAPDLTTPDPLCQLELWSPTTFTDSIDPYAEIPYENSGYHTEIPNHSALVALVASPSVSYAPEE